MPDSFKPDSSGNGNAHGDRATVTAPRRPPLLMNYARLAASEARRFKREFTRENVGSFFKTLAWVIPLTVLIWVYAVREQEGARPDVSVAIEIKSTDPSRTAMLVSPSTNVILCTLYGPRSKVDQLVNTLSPNTPLVIDIDASQPIGNDPINTLAAIANNARFKENGITVQKSSPEFLTVAVDSVLDETVPVVAPADLPTLQDVTFTPAKVKVTGPSRVLSELKAANNGNLSVTADLARLPVLHDAGPHALPVALSPLGLDGNIKIEPNTVMATLTVKNEDVAYDAANVPVEILAPPSVIEKYRIVPENNQFLLPSLKLLGPRAKIDDLKSRMDQGKSPLIAALPVDDLSSAANPRPTPLMILRLPDGVRLAGPAPQMNFTATPQ
jgi:hypothetical protein